MVVMAHMRTCTFLNLFLRACSRPILVNFACLVDCFAAWESTERSYHIN